LSVLKFLLDEDVSYKTLVRLRRQGFAVESVKTLGLLGAKNSDLLEYATSKGFILITHDRDFLFPPRKEHLGIIVVMIHPKTDAHAGKILEQFLQTIDLAKIMRKVVRLEEKYWNIQEA
jgi:predicted nuclease of predicted toxin-antitoxin system